MCGILGGISYSNTYYPSIEAISKAGRYLKYRGPDDQGTVQCDGFNSKANFFHSRLSIIDLSDLGHQPMKSVSGQSLIVFNGEIYNYKSLRNILEKEGLKFNSNSDTEVILNGYEFWGIDKLLNMLDGMFAFSLYDSQHDKLVLARDRFGKKPLYYHQSSEGLSFSSDIRSFRHIIKKDLNIDLHALGYYFSELSTPENNSIWQEIKKLSPATYLIFGENKVVETKQYWKPSYQINHRRSYNDLITDVDTLLSDAVAKRLVADVPVSALLSGGIDSSLVVAKMAENSGSRIRTYSVGFKDIAFNELSYAKKVANKFDTKHTELIIEPASLEEVHALINEFGEPFADSSMIPSYLISKEVTKNEKVVLGGDGGDELFSGYQSYYYAYMFDKIKPFIPFRKIITFLTKSPDTYRLRFLRKLLKISEEPRHSLLNRALGFSTSELQELFSNTDFYEALNKEHEKIWYQNTVSDTDDLLNTLSSSLKTRLLNDYLVKIDRSTMFASLEMRSPFLDKDLFEFASSFNPKEYYKPHGPKSPLKEIAKRYFDSDFVNRQKRGFEIPLEKWFRSEYNEPLKAVLLNKNKYIDFNLSFIERIIKEHESGKFNHVHKLWALYTFNIWSESQ